MTDGSDDALGDFFTNRDYTTHHMTFGTLSVDVKFLDAGSTDYDLTGQIPWPAAFILSNFLASDSGQSMLSGKRCLELGSGAGITGLLAAQICGPTVFSDHNDVVLDLLRENITLNSGRYAVLPQVAKLDWGRTATDALLQPGAFDAVIGSDIVYGVAAVDPLIATLDTYLSRSEDAVAVVAYILRWSNVDRAWREALARSPFHVSEVPLSEFMSAEHAPSNGTLFVLRRRT